MPAEGVAVYVHDLKYMIHISSWLGDKHHYKLFVVVSA